MACAVGSLVGAITGALIGLATESGLLRGAGIGAISGAVFAIEAVESSLDLWNSRESGIWSLLYVVSLEFFYGEVCRRTIESSRQLTGPGLLQIDILCSLLSGRIVREKVDPAMQSAVQSQVPAPHRAAAIQKLTMSMDTNLVLRCCSSADECCRSTFHR